MGRVLADIVVAILCAGKLNHLFPAQGSVQVIMRGSILLKVQVLIDSGTHKTMGCTVL